MMMSSSMMSVTEETRQEIPQTGRQQQKDKSCDRSA